MIDQFFDLGNQARGVCGERIVVNRKRAKRRDRLDNARQIRRTHDRIEAQDRFAHDTIDAISEFNRHRGIAAGKKSHRHLCWLRISPARQRASGRRQVILSYYK